MEISINRLRTNNLYTEGELRINGLYVTSTVESTETMLPTGNYSVRIVKRSARKQSICLFKHTEDSLNPNPSSLNLHETDTGWKIGIDHSWIGSKKNRIICIGKRLIPGSIYKATQPYERITDRLSKCMVRNEDITLVINDTCCTHQGPIKYWLEPSDHGCATSKRHVEVDDNGVAYIYDGDTLINIIEPQDDESDDECEPCDTPNP